MVQATLQAYYCRWGEPREDVQSTGIFHKQNVQDHKVIIIANNNYWSSIEINMPQNSIEVNQPAKDLFSLSTEACTMIVAIVDWQMEKTYTIPRIQRWQCLLFSSKWAPNQYSSIIDYYMRRKTTDFDEVYYLCRLCLFAEM